MKNFTISLGIGLNMFIQEFHTVLAQQEEKPKYQFHDPKLNRRGK
jgi:hypothetical protein